MVTCTDRKVDAPNETLRARSLPEGSVKQRATDWQERIRSVASQDQTVVRSLANLYCGDHWTQACGLVGAATNAGFAPRLWVASAGLGLQPVEPAEYSAPSYAATFSTRHADSVATSATENADWWSHLQAGSGRTTLQELGRRGAVLAVLSEVYASAMEAELLTLGGVGSEALLVGGMADIPGIQRIPSNAGLRRALGGTLTSLNVRMAASWLKHCQEGSLISPEGQSLWDKWSAHVEAQERYDRRPMTDQEVIAFITRETKRTPGISRTRLLRTLRDGGQACEQSRFANLFAQTVGKQ
ncbi:hypothetical protein [Streptodolium elevatio]|uniref:Uncharacterized protein n=1 Tax=Streptodolium elevatio TaxID=3157996 RepID=A0ABV3D8S4_9ACTN